LVRFGARSESERGDQTEATAWCYMEMVGGVSGVVVQESDQDSLKIGLLGRVHSVGSGKQERIHFSVFLWIISLKAIILLGQVG